MTREEGFELIRSCKDVLKSKELPMFEFKIEYSDETIFRLLDIASYRNSYSKRITSLHACYFIIVHNRFGLRRKWNKNKTII